MPDTYLVAFGANGSYLYSDVTGPYNCSLSPSNPDPAPGVVKACYFAPSTDDGFPVGYQQTACADESSSCTVDRNQSLAFGVQTANGWLLTYRSFDAAGTVPCTVERFGFDPAPGKPKHCYASFYSEETSFGPPGFAVCARQRETCSFVGTGAVAFGWQGRYTYKTATNGLPCTAASFGLDPVPGDTELACFYRQTALPVLSYVKCANEGPNSMCALSPTDQVYRVIFGAKGRYVSQTFVGVSSVLCNKSSFDNMDPIVLEPKSCYASRLDLVYCAVEGGTCTVPSGAVMLFGAPTDDAGQTWKYTARRVLSGNHDCNTQTFGDPAPTKVKACFYQLLDMSQRGPDTFTYCAPQNGTCQIGNAVAQVAFGVDGRYNYTTYIPPQAGSFQCTKEALGVEDPAPYSLKGCYYRLY